MTDEPVGAISLEHGDVLTDRSAEVARIWVTDGAGASVWINAGVLGDAEVFGYLMADTIRHAARAYAGNYGMTEDEALQAIVAGLSAQLREQATEITTIQDGSLN